MNPIKNLREQLDMTQHELSEATGLSQPLISQYENDERPVTGWSVRSLVSLARARGIDISYEDFFDR